MLHVDEYQDGRRPGVVPSLNHQPSSCSCLVRTVNFSICHHSSTQRASHSQLANPSCLSLRRHKFLQHESLAARVCKPRCCAPLEETESFTCHRRRTSYTSCGEQVRSATVNSWARRCVSQNRAVTIGNHTGNPQHASRHRP